MKLLLVEPPYKRKYPPLGLMKISTYYKEKGWIVDYIRGENWIDIDGIKYDQIFVTSLFTWDLPLVARTARAFKNRFKNATINIGGVAASAMPRYIEKKTGIKPYVGVLSEIDRCKPDYNISPETREMKESMVFTTRGCPHKCKYCVVRKIEPDYYPIKGWEKSIDKSKPKVVVFDNNILASSEKHLDNVLKILDGTGKSFDINSGFDVFLFKKRHAEKIANLKIRPIRFAFDKMSQEKALVRSINYCKQAGINPDKIRVYILFNYKDDLKEARYRADKVIEMGCKPFVMNYKPLNHLEKTTYISSKWTKADITNFIYYYNMPTIWNTMSYDDFIHERKYGEFEKIRKQKKKNTTFVQPLSNYL